MRLWRISNYADLDGIGGTFSRGRWHSQKHRIVYLAESPAAALLERLVHLEIDPADLPRSYQMLTVDVPDDIAVARIDVQRLPAHWRDDEAITQLEGDRWLAGNGTALLGVPSAIVADTVNWLLNPGHPDAARIQVSRVVRAPFDQRLFR